MSEDDTSKAAHDLIVWAEAASRAYGAEKVVTMLRDTAYGIAVTLLPAPDDMEIFRATMRTLKDFVHRGCPEREVRKRMLVCLISEEGDDRGNEPAAAILEEMAAGLREHEREGQPFNAI